MTKEANGAGADLIVLGRDEQGKPQAARFPANQSDLATKAAKAMNLVVGKAEGTALAELAGKLPIGRLYASGRGFVPPVRRSVYDKIVEQLRLAGQQVPKESGQGNGERPTPGLPTTWDDIAVGHLVIAHESAIEGWWEAIVLARDGDMLTLKWRDYPQQAHVTRHVGSVALMKPTPVGL
jgi:hypothetical protein